MNTFWKIILLAGVPVAAAVVVYSGAYDVGADAPHTRPVYALLETTRMRSIAARARRLQVPADLGDPARIRQGAGNYDAMCAGCHLAPGMAGTELSNGLYPSPPNLANVRIDAAEAFWAIKHGIKASGMPAWGKSMGDDYIWNMAAFLQALPTLDQARYEALVAGSGGHSHGGGETGGHAHADGMQGMGEVEGHGDQAREQADAGHPHADGLGDRRAVQAESAANAAASVTVHADGKRHEHPAKPGTFATKAAVTPEKQSATEAKSGHAHGH